MCQRYMYEWTDHYRVILKNKIVNNWDQLGLTEVGLVRFDWDWLIIFDWERSLFVLYLVSLPFGVCLVVVQFWSF